MKNIILTTLVLISSLNLFSQQFTGLSNLAGTVTCSTIDSTNGDIYVGGYLPTLHNLGRSTDGGLTFQSIAITNDTVYDIKFYQGELWFAGCFDTVNGQPAKYISRYSTTTNNIHKVKFDIRFFGGSIQDIEVVNVSIFGYPVAPTLFVCGASLRITSALSSSSIYCYDTNDTIFKVTPSVPNHVFSSNKMTTDGSTLYVYDATGVTATAGGIFYEFNGTWSLSWRGNYPINYYPTDIKWFKNSIIVAGSIGICKDRGNSIIDTAKSVKCLTLNGTNLLLGGTAFVKYNDTMFTTLGTTNALIYQLLPYGNNIYIVGSYNTINGQAVKNVSKFQEYLLPVANFVASDTAMCGSGIVNFTNTSTGSGISGYQWYFQGGDIISSNSANPTVNYSTPGSYKVTLIVTNPAGNDTIIKTGLITINQLPQQPVITQVVDTLFSDATNGNQWIFAGNEVIGENLPRFSPTDNGSYVVRVTDNNGCSATSDTINFTHSVVNGLFKVSATKISIYPNPTTDFINVTSDETFEIMDMTGKSIGKYEHTADMRNFANGTYVINLLNSGSAIIIKR